MESTTTSLQAVPSEPTTVASSAPAGERTTVPMAAQDADPVRGGPQTYGTQQLGSCLIQGLARKLWTTSPENPQLIQTSSLYGRTGQAPGLLQG